MGCGSSAAANTAAEPSPPKGASAASPRFAVDPEKAFVFPDRPPGALPSGVGDAKSSGKVVVVLVVVLMAVLLVVVLLLLTVLVVLVLLLTPLQQDLSVDIFDKDGQRLPPSASKVVKSVRMPVVLMLLLAAAVVLVLLLLLLLLTPTSR